MKGNLYLLPVTLGEGNPFEVIPQYNVEVINTLVHFVVEEGKTARKFLKSIHIARPLQELFFYELSEHTSYTDISDLLKPMLNGAHVGLMSEAGCPGVADPGAELVKLAHRNNIKVVPLVGPSSILLALMGSGFNGQNFAFVGYLPKEQGARKHRIKELEKLAKNQKQTQLFIETPYRNTQLFEELLATLHSDTLLNISCNITQPDQLIKTASVEQWKKSPLPDIQKKPCMFGIYW